MMVFGFLAEKVHDTGVLHLEPPEGAMALRADEKSQIPALERTQPLPPLGLGWVEGVTHEVKRWLASAGVPVEHGGVP